VQSEYKKANTRQTNKNALEYENFAAVIGPGQRVGQSDDNCLQAADIHHLLQMSVSIYTVSVALSSSNDVY
jgi:hypothetical protein